LATSLRKEINAMLGQRARTSFVRAAVLGAMVSLTGCGVNNIPTYEQDAKAKWSEVQNQYKRRTDLIGNLQETVRGFADQEKSVFTQVAEARSKATSVQVPADIITNPDAMKKFQEAQATLGGALRQLLVVSERYPDIKSGANFQQFQSQLEGTENRIAIARRDYIEAVRAFNTEISTIPGRWWRSLMYKTAKEMATFDIPVEETKAPKVDFGPRKN
jgi:LemA protein